MSENGTKDTPAIVVRELRRRFGRQQVLNGVNLDCPRGEITTIVGPSGCGKTVLLKHLNLLLRADSGQILIDGIDVTRLGSRGINAIREKFGMLFQAGALFDSMSVFDNVAFPLVEKTNLDREQIAQRVFEILGQVSLEGMEQKYPSELSGGMQKRTALARALIRRPKILMLDEPTTGLDPTRTSAIHELVRNTQQKFGLSAVMVSHDVPQVFNVSDRVAFMHLGKIELIGSVDEVMAADNENFKSFLAGKTSGEEERPASQVIATVGR
ncbi:MAG TPA: ATP-binding cassette domain-containing protein [Candidatus Binataceae bacterium]|nr:ATP-binding cassette domain-containing protein [Candidatus Binataceae bacterium]